MSADKPSPIKGSVFVGDSMTVGHLQKSLTTGHIHQALGGQPKAQPQSTSQASTPTKTPQK